MLSRLPKRFSTRTLLIFVAIVAVSTLVIRDYVQFQSARRRFDQAWARWNVNSFSPSDTVFESQKLFSAEASSLWISEQAARRNHVERLKRLLADMENPTRGSSSEWPGHETFALRREINKIQSSPIAPEAH